MRKQQIKQFLDLVKTLETACGELKRQRADKFLDLCAEIQEFVSCMFDYAETVFGEDTKLSNLIRELYELLFNIAQGNAHVKLVSKKALEIKSEAANLKADKVRGHPGHPLHPGLRPQCSPGDLYGKAPGPAGQGG